jgi:glycosyltransferase involved in cell wall biosynthesis
MLPSMSVFNNLSVIVPFTSGDVLWKDLLQDLKALPGESEILLVGPDEPNAEIFKKAREGVISKIQYIKSPRGRGVQLNTGARAASKDYFWFLHADSKVPRPAIYTLENELSAKPDMLHFFNLQFLADGPRLVGLNSMAANWRSKYLKMPFGDQGFAMTRAIFYRIGGFPEKAAYGEDHIFVWEARRKKIHLNPLPASIFTSARRYEAEGWGRLTSRRVLLTAKQATAECYKLFKQRIVET